MKCTIHSDAGSIMIIPRENNMVRLYIQVASSTDEDFDPRKSASAEDVQERAKKIFAPYTISWDRVEWYSVYPIGQGIAERYTLDERVFMGGDACHTHSPKAGQGMNTAFLDAVNFAWKIHHVESGWAPRSLLSTYESERKLIAETLLDFDARYAKLFSARIPSAGEVAGASAAEEAAEDNDFIKTFKASCEFTSGYGVAYNPNNVNWGPEHPAQHPLILSYEKGTSQRTGRIMTPATVTRVVDANVVHLEQEIPLNGSYRLFIFGGNLEKSATALKDLATHMSAPTSFFSSFLYKDLSTKDRYHEHHNPHSAFLSLALIFSAPRNAIHIDEQLPEPFNRYADHVYADDVWDQRVPDAKAAAHAKMGLDEIKGGVIVVRPDGYVGVVVRLEEGWGTGEALDGYFGVVTGRKLGGERASL
jgi:hypothetical protein